MISFVRALASAQLKAYKCTCISLSLVAVQKVKISAGDTNLVSGLVGSWPISHLQSHSAITSLLFRPN